MSFLLAWFEHPSTPIESRGRKKLRRQRKLPERADPKFTSNRGQDFVRKTDSIVAHHSQQTHDQLRLHEKHFPGETVHQTTFSKLACDNYQRDDSARQI